jgi:hypothetical protein
MIENQTQFAVTLQKLGKLLAGLEDLQQTVLPVNTTLYAVQSESVMEEIRRLRNELEQYCATFKVAG